MMKKSLLAVALLGAFLPFHMTEETAAAAPADTPAPEGDTQAPAVVTPTKESLIARVESLFTAGYEGVAGVLHDVLVDVESFFGHTAPAAAAEQPEDTAAIDQEKTDAGNEQAPAAQAEQPAS